MICLYIQSVPTEESVFTSWRRVTGWGQGGMSGRGDVCVDSLFVERTCCLEWAPVHFTGVWSAVSPARPIGFFLIPLLKGSYPDLKIVPVKVWEGSTPVCTVLRVY